MSPLVGLNDDEQLPETIVEAEIEGCRYGKPQKNQRGALTYSVMHGSIGKMTHRKGLTMAKRKTVKKGQKATQRRKPDSVADDAGTTSYSTRFNPAQREVIEAGAKMLGWSPARLIREAAVTRAVHLVNGGGVSGLRLRELAKWIRNQVRDPSVEFVRERFNEYTQEPERETVRLSCEQLRKQRSEETPSGIAENSVEERSINMIRAGKEEANQIKEALETGGTELVRLLLEEWEACDVDDGVYEARVRPESVLGGDEED